MSRASERAERRARRLLDPWVGANEGKQMRVLSRQTGERVRIGEAVEVAILAITGSDVVIGIAAPPNKGIRRVAPPCPDPAEPPALGVHALDPDDRPQPGLEFEYWHLNASDLPEPGRRGRLQRPGVAGGPAACSRLTPRGRVRPTPR